MSDRQLTVIVACHDDHRLRAALMSAQHPAVERLVVLNGAPPSMHELVATMADRVISLPVAGLGAARQVGLDTVRTPSCMFLDSDCTIRPGGIPRILRALENYDVVRVGLEYQASSAGERLVAKVRRLTTIDTAIPLLPLAMNMDAIRTMDEPLFDCALRWGEDWPAAQRLMRSGLCLGILNEPAVLHLPLGIRQDLASARKLGQGRSLRTQNGLETPRSLWNDMLQRHELRRFVATWRRAGPVAALYHFAGWRLAYKFGYYEFSLREGWRR